MYRLYTKKNKRKGNVKTGLIEGAFLQMNSRR